MKTLTALIRREYLEHRGAFLYAPTLILVVLLVITASGVAFGRFQLDERMALLPALKVFEFGTLALSALWAFYLMVALFFYYADAFSADLRNNAMLFWKSMPVSDFGMMASKMLAGLSLFPLLILAAMLMTALIVFGGTTLSALTLGSPVPSLLAYLSSLVQIGGFVVVALALALLWYAPFFAWVGLLSTLFRRWSIPLAFLIPGLAGLAENLLFRNAGPEGGYLLSYLQRRMQFGDSRMEIGDGFLTAGPFDAGQMLGRLVSSIDWTQFAGGLIVTALLVFVASEYRRRSVAS
jgi:ABC-2 type transport system permease protein